MALELFMRFLSFVFSKIGAAFLIGFMMASFVSHNSINYAGFIADLNEFFIRVVITILGL